MKHYIYSQYAHKIISKIPNPAEDTSLKIEQPMIVPPQRKFKNLIIVLQSVPSPILLNLFLYRLKK